MYWKNAFVRGSDTINPIGCRRCIIFPRRHRSTRLAVSELMIASTMRGLRSPRSQNTYKRKETGFCKARGTRSGLQTSAHIVQTRTASRRVRTCRACLFLLRDPRVITIVKNTNCDWNADRASYIRNKRETMAHRLTIAAV